MKTRRIVLSLATLALTFLLAAPALAAIEFVGKLVSVDGNLLSVTDGSSQQTVEANKDTKITIQGKEAKLSDLKVDQDVKVTVEPDGDKLIAKTIAAE